MVITKIINHDDKVRHVTELTLVAVDASHPESTPKVAIVRSNPAWNDPRVLRIAGTLSKEFEVLVLAWDRDDSYNAYERLGNRLLVKRLKLRAPYGSPLLVLYFPLFWLWVFVNLLAYRPQVIHACDLDALVPSSCFRTLFKTRVVFDSFDRYAMAFIPPRRSFVYRCVDEFEDLLASGTDALVTVSNERLATFKRRPRRTEVIMNCPEDLLDTIKSQIQCPPRKDNDFVMVYAGGIASDRGLLLLSEAIRGFSHFHLILAGRVINGSLLRALLRNPRIKYIGQLSHYEALRLQAFANAIPILYDPTVPINRVANPNKLFEAMMLGIPVITNVCEEIVAKCGCGLVTEYEPNAVRRAIVRLMRSGSLARKMGARGRVGFTKKYNWTKMESKLVAMYKQLLLDWT